MLLLKRILIFTLCAALCAALTAPAAAQGEPSVSAESCILVHADTGRVLYERDADREMLIASTTKLLTALVVLDYCALEEQVEITAGSAGIEGSSMYLKAGQLRTVEQLLYGMLLVSGNDAAMALALHTAGSAGAFAELMNEKAESLGMTESHFMNPHGLDEEGHYSTARDLAKLGVACMESDTLRRIVSAKSFTVDGCVYLNHNKLLWRCDGCVGEKTGYTKAAGRSLVSLLCRDGLRLVCVTLGDPNDWDDHAALYDWASERWKWERLDKAIDGFTVPVISGTQDRVAVAAEPGLGALLLRSQSPQVKIELPRFVFAPVEAASCAGSVTFTVDGETVAQGQLTYAASVSRKAGIQLTPWERFKRVWAMTGKALGPYYYVGER